MYFYRGNVNPLEVVQTNSGGVGFFGVLVRVEKRPAVLNYEIGQFESFVYVVGNRKLRVERSVCVNVQACDGEIRHTATFVAVQKTVYITLFILIFYGIDVVALRRKFLFGALVCQRMQSHKHAVVIEKVSAVVIGFDLVIFVLMNDFLLIGFGF